MPNIIQKISEIIQKKNKEESTSKYHPLLPLGIILIASIAVRIYALINAGEFTWDEMFSFYYSQKSWANLLKIMLWETNPPLHLFLSKIYFSFFPANELWARIPNLIISLLSLTFVYYWTKKLFSQKVAIGAALIFSFHPFIVYASTLNRIYSILAFLSIISYYFFQKIFLEKSEEKKYYQQILFTLSQLLLFFSHLTSAFIILSQLITLLICARFKIKKYVLLNLPPLILFLIWFVPSWWLKFTAPNIADAWFFRIESPNNYISALASIFTNTNINWLNIFIFILILIGLTKIIIEQIKNKNNNINFWLILIPVIINMYLVIIGRLWQPKFFIISLPFIAILTSYTLIKLISPKIFFFLFFVIAILNINHWSLIPQSNSWKIFNERMKSEAMNEKKQIIINTHYVDWIYFPRYYDAPQKQLIYRPQFIDWDELIVKQNYRYYRQEDENAKNWIEKISLNYDEIILLQDFVNGVNLEKTLDELKWNKTSELTDLKNPAKKNIIFYVKP